MDRTRRQKLREAIDHLKSASVIVDTVCDAETDCMDNVPENLQYSDRYEKMEQAVDGLNDALELIDNAMEYIRAAAC